MMKYFAMTRRDVIEEAKKALPSFKENTQHKVRIRVADYNDIQVHYDSELMTHIETPKVHEVIFNRCYVGKDLIITNCYDEIPNGYKLAWIPEEYFNMSIGKISDYSILNEYLLK